MTSKTNLCHISMIESKNTNDALRDEYCVNAIHKELDQFIKNNT